MPKPAPRMMPAPQQNEEEDLEVPTFIRRKMRERKQHLGQDDIE
jgi:hypothetical protein